MAVMLTVGGAMGFYGVRDSNSAISELFTNQLPSVEAIGASRIALLRAITFLDRAIAHPADENAVENLKNINNLILKSDENWKKYVALPAEEEERKMTVGVQESREKFFKEAIQPMLAAITAGNTEEADRINGKVVPNLFAIYVEKVTALNDFQFKSAEQVLKEKQSAFTTFIWIDVLGVILGLGTVFVFAYYLLVAISNPLKFLLKQFESIGNGDLSYQIKPNSNDEMGQLLAGLENMRQSLVQTVTVVKIGRASCRERVLLWV